MTTQPYQEEDGAIFEFMGDHYDLNLMLREVAHLPMLTIKVNNLLWSITRPWLRQNRSRVESADLDAPLLITMWEGRHLVVAGFHRTVKAFETGERRLPYHRVSPQLFKAAKLAPGQRPLPAHRPAAD